MFPIFLLAHEHETFGQAHEFQLFLMRKILGARQARHPLHETRLVESDMREDDVCIWRGVQCTKGIVTGIVWKQGIRSISLQTVLYEWFPPSIETIDFERLCTRDYVETRCLPGKLRHFRVVACRLRGPFDMQTLPVLLEMLDIRKNDFSGVVHLDLLPQTIQIINLSGNRFTKALVCNHRLPVALQRAYLTQSDEVMFRCICTDEKTLDARLEVGNRSQ